MARTINIHAFPTTEQAEYIATAEDHGAAKKISDKSAQTLRRFARGLDVTTGDLTLAIVEGLHADATRFGQSAVRRSHADPLLRLAHAVRLVTPPVATEQPERKAPTESVADQTAIAERRYALSLLTPEQRAKFNAYADGLRVGAAMER